MGEWIAGGFLAFCAGMIVFCLWNLWLLRPGADEKPQKPEDDGWHCIAPGVVEFRDTGITVRLRKGQYGLADWETQWPGGRRNVSHTLDVAKWAVARDLSELREAGIDLEKTLA